MKEKSVTNIAASVKIRLMNVAKERHCSFNMLLSRYANERFLYRLSISEYREHFILKGSNLFLIWQNGYPYRPTMDSDFLVIGQSDQNYLKSIFTELCTLQVDIPDGLHFERESVTSSEIREEAQYGGTRITLNGTLGNVKIYLRFDIGIGDAVTPAPETSVYPTILNSEPFILRTYPQETAIAEKTKTIITLGEANSRMKDFADILVLQRHFNYEYTLLQTAIRRTFERYRISFPESIPTCFTKRFSDSSVKQKMWTAFCTKSQITDLPDSFSAVVSECADFLLPLFFPPSIIPSHWTARQGWGNGASEL